MLHCGIYLDTVLTGYRGMKRTVGHQNFLTLMGQISTDVMFPSFTRKPRYPKCNVSDTLALISQFIDSGLGRYLQRSSCLHIIGLSREETGQIRKVRKYLTDLSQPDALQLHVNILQ